MDLFDYMKEKTLEKESPLASRMRPTVLEEVVGQEHIIGPGKLLYRAIKADKLGSIIFYGPPGTGKTTLAKVIANTTSAQFEQLNATTAGKKDMEAVVERAKNLLGMYGKKTILFIDEIHRFNKGQQDYLLPFVEDGTLILIGATTENPYFEVNRALLSRSVIFELKPLKKEEIEKLLVKAVTDSEKGMGMYQAKLEDDAREFLADISGGDARAALNAIELAILTTPVSPDGKIHIDLDTASECIQKRAVHYDKDGDQHYDTISAFIKSMRGSDPDAAVYYLAKMLSAGEDIKFIARRMMICASEDVGNADPMALTVAVSASLAAERSPIRPAGSRPSSANRSSGWITPVIWFWSSVFPAWRTPPAKCLTPSPGAMSSVRCPATILSLSSCARRKRRPISAASCSSIPRAAADIRRKRKGRTLCSQNSKSKMWL